jgi:hypothetical protein
VHIWLPLIVGVGNLASVALTGTGRWQGWPVLIAAQTTFTVYGALTSQQALWLLNGGMVVFASIMWRRWSRQRRAGYVAPGTTVRRIPVDEFPASWIDHG